MCMCMCARWAADGAYIVADNVIYPGAPDYLKYVRNAPQFTSTHHESHLEYSSSIIDGIEVSVYNKAAAGK